MMWWLSLLGQYLHKVAFVVHLQNYFRGGGCHYLDSIDEVAFSNRGNGFVHPTSKLPVARRRQERDCVDHHLEARPVSLLANAYVW